MPRSPLADLVARAFTGAPLIIEAYDGSTAGPPDAQIRLVLRSPKALSYLIPAPPSLGFARAYVSGELEIHGDLYKALQVVWSSNIGHLQWPERIANLRSIEPHALRLGAAAGAGRGARGGGGGGGGGGAARRGGGGGGGKKNTHHYDVSNRFYEWV